MSHPKGISESGLAQKNSHLRNTEQQPDVSVAARHPRDTNYQGAAQTPRLRPFHNTQILTVISIISIVNKKILTVRNSNLNLKQ